MEDITQNKRLKNNLLKELDIISREKDSSKRTKLINNIIDKNREKKYNNNNINKFSKIVNNEEPEFIKNNNNMIVNVNSSKMTYPYLSDKDIQRIKSLHRNNSFKNESQLKLVSSEDKKYYLKYKKLRNDILLSRNLKRQIMNYLPNENKLSYYSIYGNLREMTIINNDNDYKLLLDNNGIIKQQFTELIFNHEFINNFYDKKSIYNLDDIRNQIIGENILKIEINYRRYRDYNEKKFGDNIFIVSLIKGCNNLKSLVINGDYNFDFNTMEMIARECKRLKNFVFSYDSNIINFEHLIYILNKFKYLEKLHLIERYSGSYWYQANNHIHNHINNNHIHNHINNNIPKLNKLKLKEFVLEKGYNMITNSNLELIIDNCPELEFLSIENDIPLYLLSKIITKCKKIKNLKFNLSNDNLEESNNIISKLRNNKLKFNELENLDISIVNMDRVNNILDFLLGHSLKKLILKRNITDDICDIISNNCVNLTSLSFTSSIFSNKMINISRKCKLLKELTIEMHPMYQNNNINHIIIENNNNINNFLNRNNINYTRTENQHNNFIEFIKNCNNLEVLNMSNKDYRHDFYLSYLYIRDDVLEVISNICPNLKILDIPHNKFITDDALIKVVKNCTKLKHLNIKGCTRISDKGLEAITENCKNLEFLDISKCYKITKNGLMKIVDNYENLKKLKILYIRCITSMTAKTIRLLGEKIPIVITAISGNNEYFNIEENNNIEQNNNIEPNINYSKYLKKLFKTENNENNENYENNEIND